MASELKSSESFLRSTIERQPARLDAELRTDGYGADPDVEKYSNIAKLAKFCHVEKKKTGRQDLCRPSHVLAMGMAQSLLKLAGLDCQVPDFSTGSRRQKHLSVTIAAQPTTTGLHLLVDSTGIKMLGEGQWKTKKHGAHYRRQWRKVSIGIDANAAMPARPDSR